MTKQELAARQHQYREYLKLPSAQIERFLDQLDDERTRRDSKMLVYAPDGAKLNLHYDGFSRKHLNFWRYLKVEKV